MLFKSHLIDCNNSLFFTSYMIQIVKILVQIYKAPHMPHIDGTPRVLKAY